MSLSSSDDVSAESSSSSSSSPFSLSAEVILAEQYGLHREQSNEVHVECEVVDHYKEDHVGFPDIDCIHESVQFKRILRTY